MCVHTCSDRALAYMRHTPHAARGPYYKTTTQAACNEGIRTGRMHTKHAGYDEPSTSTQAGEARRPHRDPSLQAGSTTRFDGTQKSLARERERLAAVSKLPGHQRIRKAKRQAKEYPTRLLHINFLNTNRDGDGTQQWCRVGLWQQRQRGRGHGRYRRGPPALGCCSAHCNGLIDPRRVSPGALHPRLTSENEKALAAKVVPESLARSWPRSRETAFLAKVCPELGPVTTG